MKILNWFLSFAMFFCGSLGVKASKWTESFLEKKQSSFFEEKPAEFCLGNLSLRLWKPKKDKKIFGLSFRYNLEEGIFELTKNELSEKSKLEDFEIKFQKKFKNSFFDLTRKKEKGKELYELKIPHVTFFKLEPEEIYGARYSDKIGSYEIMESEKGIITKLSRQFGKGILQLQHSQENIIKYTEGKNLIELKKDKTGKLESYVVKEIGNFTMGVIEKKEEKGIKYANKDIVFEIKEKKGKEMSIEKKLENGSLELKLGEKEKIKYSGKNESIELTKTKDEEEIKTSKKFGDMKVNMEYKEGLKNATLETKVFDSNIKFSYKPEEKDVYGKIEKEFSGGKIVFAHEKVAVEEKGKKQEKEQLLAKFSKKFGKNELSISYKELPVRKEKETSGLKTEIRKYFGNNIFLTIAHFLDEYEKIRKYNAGLLSETSNYSLGMKYGFAKPKLSMRQKNLGLTLKIKNINLEIGADYFWQDNIEKGKFGVKTGMNFSF